MRNKDVDTKPVMGGEERSAISRLRLLDFDDLFLLSHLLGGATIAATAKQLGLTQPAITQRVRKIERVFNEPLLQKAGRHVRLTKEGRAVCVKATDALAMMRAVTAEPPPTALTVGADPVAAASWLWPVVAELHEIAPAELFHVVVAAPDELSAMLESGAVSAMLSAAAESSGQRAVMALGDAEFVFVARPDLAAGIHSIADLEKVLLLELDRSYPLLGRLEAQARSAVRFRDVWFHGATAPIVQAALMGHGVAILPEALVTGAVSAGRLSQILPELDLTPEPLNLVYRRSGAPEALIARLAAQFAKHR